jgi:multiple sugar transport system permease protein
VGQEPRGTPILETGSTSTAAIPCGERSEELSVVPAISRKEARSGWAWSGWARAIWIGATQTWVALLFLLPSIALVVAVTFYPIAHAIRISLYDTFYLKTTKFVGLQHYLKFLQDPAGWNNVVSSLTFTFGSLAIAIPLGLGLALLLNMPIRCRVLFRTLIIVPWVVSQIVTALLWGWLVNAQYGPVNYFINEWFGAPFDFLGNPASAMPTLILTNVWRSFPYPMLLLLAALQTVPEQLHEAAKVDGANTLQRFWRITIPMIRNTLLITVIMLSLHYFNMITLPFILTGGGPVGATDVLSLRVYQEAFSFYHMGLASAVAVYIFAFNIVFSLLYIKILRTEAYH